MNAPLTSAPPAISAANAEAAAGTKRLTPAMPAATAPASVVQVGRAVFWSFIGIRQRAGHANDVARITPLQAIVAGLIGAALFVTSLVVLVKILTAK